MQPCLATLRAAAVILRPPCTATLQQTGWQPVRINLWPDDDVRQWASTIATITHVRLTLLAMPPECCLAHALMDVECVYTTVA